MGKRWGFRMARGLRVEGKGALGAECRVDFVRKYSGLRLGLPILFTLLTLPIYPPPHPERFPTGDLMLWIQVFAG
jgi:hypothetical protein